MTDPNVESPTPKRRGCFFYGCLTSVVLLLVAALLVFFVARYAKNKFNSLTDSQPMKMPKVEMTDAEFQVLRERLKTFGTALEQGKSAEPLTLTERDLNALIALSGNTKELADKVHVSLNGNQVKGMISIPLSGIPWLGKGRYLNGDATFKVSLENGVLLVTAEEIRVKGEPIPDSIMNEIRRENLAKDAYKDPKNAEAIRKFDSIQVEDSQVTVKARAAK